MINIVVCILISHELKPLHNKIGFSTNNIYVFLLIFGKLEEILSKIWFLKPAFFLMFLDTTVTDDFKSYQRLNLVSVSLMSTWILFPSVLVAFTVYLKHLCNFSIPIWCHVLSISNTHERDFSTIFTWILIIF